VTVRIALVCANRGIGLELCASSPAGEACLDRRGDALLILPQEGHISVLTAAAVQALEWLAQAYPASRHLGAQQPDRARRFVEFSTPAGPQ
jgi:hypothetical protein